MLGLTLGFSDVAVSQAVNRQLPPGQTQKSNPSDFPDPENEMLSRNLIDREQQNHRETIRKAHETAQLASSIKDNFLKKNSLDQINQKNLVKIEKLIKRIRSDAGGSESEADPAAGPATLAEALDRLVKLTESLRDDVENTPRQVISATTIDLATQTIDLLKIIRSY
ncbi:MAG: hypothetical protein ACRD4L_13555 [Pyrinomonadaceae bacterium]